jgi:hypothetical protein
MENAQMSDVTKLRDLEFKITDTMNLIEALDHGD